MPFLILGKNIDPNGPSRYRGTDREWPPFDDELSKDTAYSELFHWYIKDAHLRPGVNDINGARQLLTYVCTRLHRYEFELIEAVRLGDTVTVGGTKLGYDLSVACGYSLLSWGLDLTGGTTSPPIDQLVELVQAHFQPMLNAHGLFSEEETALFCLRSMMALQALWPGLWENETVHFEVTAIYKPQE